MTSARERVFATPELLEAILIQLHHVAPLHELLQAQLISHRFNTAIISSPRLQQLLFFRVEPRNNSRLLADWTSNPLLRRHFLPWFVQGDNEGKMPNYESLRMLDWNPDRKDAFLRAEASWRNMLAVQSAPKELLVTEVCQTRGGDFLREATLSFADSAPGGVTMGALYDIAEYFVCIHRVSRFWLCIKTSDTGPQMTLYLMYTKQCCPSIANRDGFTSQGAKRYHELNKAEMKPVKEKRNLDWETDLLPQRGGVSPWDWAEWKRKRAPISDLLSDVRGG